MSAILGIFGPDAASAPARALLAGMASRGGEISDLWVSADAVLGVSRHGWECEAGFAGPAAVAHDGENVCVSDASLHYRDDLRRTLAAAGIASDRSAAPATLILSAYRAWGANCAALLEGDFAFIVYDRASRRVVASRDFGGKRPLHHAVRGGQLVLASSVRTIAEYLGSPDSYDHRVLAATIAQLWAASDETWHRDVRELLSGTTIVRERELQPRISRHWNPRVGPASRTSFDDAAAELRALLERSTLERMAPSGPTAIWMSGGWDSPSVFGAGMSRLRSSSDARPLLPVSLSYPEGDPGREDELIDAIAAHWQVPVRWVDVESIPFLVDPIRTAGDREGPFAHTYEHWNRRLAAEACALGARVVFDGNGGDQLFAISSIFLTDLFWQGKWGTLARDWRAMGGGRNWRGFLRHAVIPGMPGPIRSTFDAMRGRRTLGHMERPLPPWFEPGFVARSAVQEWERTHLEAYRTDGEWETEALRFVTLPSFGRILQELTGLARDAGVELRSPLLDERVIAFALTRPREERYSGRETKRLLRRAMRGLLPDHVLAPRAQRTGITSAFSDRRLRESVPALLAQTLSRPMLLAEMGIIDPKRFGTEWDRYVRTGAADVKIPLFLTLQTEFWLRARDAEQSRESSHAAPEHHTWTGEVQSDDVVVVSP